MLQYTRNYSRNIPSFEANRDKSTNEICRIVPGEIGINRTRITLSGEFTGGGGKTARSSRSVPGHHLFPFAADQFSSSLRADPTVRYKQCFPLIYPPNPIGSESACHLYPQRTQRRPRSSHVAHCISDTQLARQSQKYWL